MSEKIIQLIGNELVSSDGKIKSEDLKLNDGDLLGLYFSAHWCPPCRGFTPKLAEFYNSQKEKGGCKFEVVFVSADKDQSSFEAYFKTMPWYAVAFDNDNIKDKLTKLCGVRGIPMLVIFDSNGNILHKDGREKVLKKPEDFPWGA